MEGPRISLDPSQEPQQPTLPGLPAPLVPLRSRRRHRARHKPRPEPPYRRLRDGLTLLGWCAMFLAAGFLAAAQPPSTYTFFSRLGYTRTLWDQGMLNGALFSSVFATLVATIAFGLPGTRLFRLWGLLVVAGLATAGLALR